MANKIKKPKKYKLQGGLDAKNLRTKPVREVLTTLQKSNLDSTAAASFMEDLANEGYPYIGRVTPTESGMDINFEREVEGYSKNWVNTKKNPDGSVGGYSYGVRYKDGDYEPTDESSFKKGTKILKTKTKQGKKVYAPITEQSKPYTELPELAGGIDLTRKMEGNLSTPLLPTDNIDADVKSASSKLAPTTTKIPLNPSNTKSTSGGTLPLGEIGNFAGTMVETFDPQRDGKSSVAGSSLKLAGQGASMGMAVGGPIGAGVGALVGGVGGAISASSKNKKIEDQLEEERLIEQNAQIANTVQPAKNTQAPIYEDGTIAANISQPVEVEKDEIVLRKNNKGQYYMAADFKNGKTHEQGGEDFSIKEGDVVFPGKKRKTIMRHIKNNNMPGIESERMKLPKDLPNNEELQDGINNESAYTPEKWRAHRSRILSEVDPEVIREVREPFIKKQEEKIKRIHDKIKTKLENGEITEAEAEQQRQQIASDVYGQTNESIERAYRKKFPEYNSFYEKFSPPSNLDMFDIGARTADMGEDLQFTGIDDSTPMDNWNTVVGEDTSTPSWLGGPIGLTSTGLINKGQENKEIANYKPEEKAKASAQVNPVDVAKSEAEKLGKYTTTPLEGKEDVRLPNADISQIESTLATQSQPEVKTVSDVVPSSTESGTNSQSVGTDAMEAMRYIPAATNMLKGMQTPERVERRSFMPEEQTYKDMSEGMRQEANLQRRIESDNASRFSGGSAQVSRAGKSMAGSRWFKRRQGINEAEAQRAQQIEAQNIGTRNQAKSVNLQLENQYDQMDAQNRSAVDAYFDQGLHDFGRIGSQIRRDKKMERTQDIALELIQSPEFKYDKEGNKIKFKG